VTGVFKQKTPANIIILLVLGVLIKLPMFSHPHIPEIKAGDGVLYRAILDALVSKGTTNALVFPVLTFILLFIEAVLLNFFINRHRMMSRSTWYPAMGYLLITSYLPEWNYFSAPLLVNLVLVFVLSVLFNSHSQQRAQGAIFNIGFGLGISSFLFFPSITFLVWILLALAIMRPFNPKEWLICIIGATTPFYFYAVYLFINNEWHWSSLWPYFSISLPQVKQSAWLAGSAFLLLIPFLTGGYYVQESLRRMLIQVRKGWSLLLLYLFGALFIPFVNNSNSFENWIMAAIPLASFHACTYLYSSYRIYPLLLFWLSVAFIIGYQYWGPGW
jgi:hypothetical protein